MASKVTVKIDKPQQVLLKRYLNSNGEAQARFTKQYAKWMNNYIPFKSGRLKDMNVVVTRNKITYEAPYARKQFYTNKGTGKGGTAQGGLRGKRWDKRCWADKGSLILDDLASFVGGRIK